MANTFVRVSRLVGLVTLLFLSMQEPVAQAKTPQQVSLSAPYTPKAGPLPLLGEGLCGSYRARPEIDDGTWGLEFSEGLFTPPLKLHDEVNRFFDGGTYNTNRWDYTVEKPFDFSVNGKEGDYGGVTATPECGNGCPFNPPQALNVKSTYFSSRYRGYLNVPEIWATRKLYIGVRADDGTYLAIFDQAGAAPQLVMTTGPKSGFGADEGFRVINEVVFPKAGLYPVEVGYVQLPNKGTLEMAIFSLDRAPADRLKQCSLDDPMPMCTPRFPQEQEAGPTTIPLHEWPMTLFTKELFFQSPTGQHAFPDRNRCRQCPRSRIGENAAKGTCDAGYYCNTAALCDRCNVPDHCGEDCSACPAGQFCEAGKCVVCQENSHCPPGQRCENNKCVECTEDKSCAGNSCNCCPPGSTCQQNSSKQYICARCKTDADCPDGRCAPDTLRCIPKSEKACGTDGPTERCGGSCDLCPQERPYCLDGNVCVQCRKDPDCGPGNFCNSGECVPCIIEKRCGLRCGSCTPDLPFCFNKDNRGANARCVECLDNAHCGKGGVCDQTTLKCQKPCENGCAAGERCLADQCVQCVTDAHCPCGGTCDAKTRTCNPMCNGTEDCLSTECCSKKTGQCVPGRCKPGAGVLCCGVGSCAEVEGSATTSTLTVGAAFATLALLLRRRRRQQAITHRS